jgi:integrase
MAKVDLLSALKVTRINEPGMYLDGRGLYLQVVAAPTADEPHRVTKSWIFRYALNGRPRKMGLGSAHDVTLAQARAKAADARKQAKEGIDPIDDRHVKVVAKDAAEAKAAARAVTFDQCADTYIAAHEAGWRNAKHRQQWRNTLATYASPVFGKLAVGEVDTAMVLKVIEPVWAKKLETASRVRNRIENILDYARVSGYRTGENPARWRGHLDHLLPARSRVRTVKHHAALPYAQVGAFMTELREREAVAARALEFAILTAARTGEVIGARWSEIDLQAKVWTVPEERMKGGREHRVPLSGVALAVLRRLQLALQDNTDYVFPGDRRATLSNMALLMLLRRMDRVDLTAHGFRSTFRTWAAERSRFPREVVEAALAHVVGDKTETAYQRGDLFEKRRQLMAAWAEFCSKPAAPGQVLEFPNHGKKRQSAAARQ